MASKTQVPADDKPDWDDIEFVRKLVLHSIKTDESIESFDPDVFELINENVKFPIFIENGNVFNKDELLAKYNLIKLIEKNPEDIFARQQISYYEAKNMKGEVMPDLCEHIVHDEGKEALSVKDQLYIMKNVNSKVRKPTKIINTCIYIAREDWDHFLFLNKLGKTIHTFRDVKLLADSPIGKTLLLEAPRAETKLNHQNGSDNIINHQSNEMNNPSSNKIEETGSVPAKQDNKDSVQFPDILGGKVGVDCLTFIIQPMKGQYDLYPEINKAQSPKMGDAGTDIPFCEDMSVPSFITIDGIGTTIDLGVKCCLVDEKGNFHSYFIMPRSSINKTPLQLTNSVGLADLGYRGNLKAGLRNFSSKEYKQTRGTAMFQLVPRNEVPFKYVIVNEKSPLYAILNQNTERGSGGFGSTGAKGNT